MRVGLIPEWRWRRRVHRSISPRPVDRFGPLAVRTGRLIGGDVIANLSGMSLFWPNSQRRFFTPETVRWLARDWQIDVVRVPIGVAPDGPPLALVQAVALAKRVINSALAEGVYVIVDWHAHDQLAEAAPCLAAIAAHYGDLPHLLYEPWNEPDPRWGWHIVRSYHKQAIDAIRRHAPSALIVAGTPEHCRGVDVAAQAPVEHPNIAYALHFYAGTHREGLRRRAVQAIGAGLPLIVTEWGACEAHGDGVIDWSETARWLDFLDRNAIGDVAWAISDKAESCSALMATAATDGGWRRRDLTRIGRFYRRRLRLRQL